MTTKTEQLKKLSQNELNDILEKHQLFLTDSSLEDAQIAVFENVILDNLDFSGTNLSRAVFVKNVVASFSNFNKTTIEHVNFEKVLLKQCSFDEAAIIQSIFSSVENCSFKECQILQACFDRASIKESNFSGSEIDMCNFVNTDITRTEFTNCYLKHTDFDCSQLLEIDFSSARVIKLCGFNELRVFLLSKLPDSVSFSMMKNDLSEGIL